MDAMQGRRLLLGAIGAAAFAGSCRRALGATAALEERPVAGFDEVVWDAAGELAIEQTGRERLVIEAEPAVLRKIVTRVRERRLEIGFAPGRVEAEAPLRFRLQVSALRRLELRGSGDARIGALQSDALALALHGSVNLRLERLQARTLDLLLAGAGEVRIGGGQVESQRIALDGAGTVHASRLDSRLAEVSLAGSGDIHVGVAERLLARIDGSGDIVYRGQPQVRERVNGAGAVVRGGG